MKRQSRALVALGMTFCSLMTMSLAAAPPWQSLIPFKRVEADPAKEYRLTENDGPWLIMCRSFAGDTAQQDARALVLELRQRFKLKAFLHFKQYDFTDTETDVAWRYDRYGKLKRMKPLNPTKFQEYAVLVGDFHSADDAQVEDTLEKIKYARPACLEIDVKSGKGTSQRYWGLRVTARSKADKTDGKGPMRMAFLTRNPLLPDEYFAPKGLDPLVKDMNKGLEFSLLKNPGNYTVRIATFRGNSTTTIREKDYEKAAQAEFGKSRLQEGADRAARLVEWLRSKGVEAYEFHDLHESMVTVGSFETVGDKAADGSIVYTAAIQRVIDQYKAPAAGTPGQAQAGSRTVAGVMLDVVPVPVAVPKESIGAAYAHGNR